MPINKIGTSFWTDTDGPHGSFRDQAKVPGQQPTKSTQKRLLVVFLHGILSDRRCWGEVPRLVHESLCQQFDSLSLQPEVRAAYGQIDYLAFEYPAQWWQTGSLSDAARLLGDALNHTYRDYPDVILVAHSFGGLVVKQMLTSGRYNEEPTLWKRIKFVYNVAVPHNGGKIYLMPPIILYSLFGWTWHLIGILLNQVVPARGFNWIFPTLFWRAPWLRQLEKTYLIEYRRLLESGGTYHTVFDALAAWDNAVDQSGSELDTDSKNIPIRILSGQMSRLRRDRGALRSSFLPGDHVSIKNVKESNAPIVVSITTSIFQVIENYSPVSRMDPILANLSVNLANNRDRKARVKDLITGTAPDSLRSVAEATCGSQTEIRDRLLERIESGSRRLVLSGLAGTGKSSVVRDLVRRFGIQFRSVNRTNRLAMVFPLQQLELDASVLQTLAKAVPEQTGHFFWQSLIDSWCKWVNRLVPTMDQNAKLKMSSEWLHFRHAEYPSVIVLDGVDEFLIRYRSVVRLAHLQALLKAVEDRYRFNPSFTVLLAIRSGQPGLHELVSRNEDLFEITRLSPEQADSLYPGVKNVLSMLPDNSILRDLLCTPLLLPRLGPRIKAATEGDTLQQLLGKLTSRAEIIQFALNTLIEESGLQSLQDGSATTENVADALTVIGWIFFVHFFQNSSAELSKDTLRAEAEKITDRWADFAKHSHLAEGIRDGFALASDEATLDTLLNQTVFFPTAEGTYRFQHIEWFDFLGGRYESRCIQSENMDEWSQLSFPPAMVYTAAELLGDKEITRDLVKRVIQHTVETNNRLVLGVFFSLVSLSSRVRFKWNAMEPILQFISGTSDPVLHCVILNGLCHRVLMDQVHSPEDPSPEARLLQTNMVPKLEEYLGSDKTDPVIRSLSWCYLKAFGNALSSPIPSLDGADALIQARAAVCKGQDLGAERSLQTSMMQLAQEVRRSPATRPISSVHYLYYATVAFHVGRVGDDLLDPLRDFFRLGGPDEEKFSKYQLVEEVKTLYKTCQRLYLNPLASNPLATDQGDNCDLQPDRPSVRR